MTSGRPGKDPPDELAHDDLVAAVQSREHFLSEVLGSLESFVTVDSEWRCTFANEAAAKLVGIGPAELIGLELLHYAPKAGVDEALALLQKAMNERVTVEFDVEDAGRGRSYRGRAYPLSDGGLAIYLRNVTDRKRAEEALRESEQRFRLLLSAAPVTVAAQDRELRFVWAFNQKTAPPGGVIGLTDEEIFLPEEAEHLRAVKQRVLETGAEHREQLWLDRPQGRMFLDCTFAPLRDERGEVSGIGVTTVDLTPMKLIEEKLRQSREDLDRAQAVGQVGSWRLDVRADVLTWSDENYRIFGLPIGTPLTYETFLSVVHPEDRAFVDARWLEALRGAPYDIEHRLLVGGQVKWVRERAFLEYDEANDLLGGFGITQDVTERRLAEQALLEKEAEKAAQRERLRLARDLHDSVTQALFAASIKAESLTMTCDLPKRESETLEDVRRLNRGALAHMRLLLLELRSDPLEKVPLPQLLGQLVEATESRVSADVWLKVSGEAELPAVVHVALYRITQEALNNVVKHAGASNAWVVLELAAGSAHLEVGDDGCGFDPDLVSDSCLGLWSIRERADEAGAQLSVETGPGCRGARVIVQWRGEG